MFFYTGVPIKKTKQRERERKDCVMRSMIKRIRKWIISSHLVNDPCEMTFYLSEIRRKKNCIKLQYLVEENDDDDYEEEESQIFELCSSIKVVELNLKY